jgi:hypothetical protein
MLYTLLFITFYLPLWAYALIAASAFILVVWSRMGVSPTPPQYQILPDMTIRAIVFFREPQAKSAFTRMHDTSITDGNATFPSANGYFWESVQIKSGTLTQSPLINSRTPSDPVSQRLTFDCSATPLLSLQLFLSWLRNDSVSCFVIDELGDARRLSNLTWKDFKNRSFALEATAPSIAPVVASYKYSVTYSGTHSFYAAYNGGYGGEPQGIGAWMLG